MRLKLKRGVWREGKKGYLGMTRGAFCQLLAPLALFREDEVVTADSKKRGMKDCEEGEEVPEVIRMAGLGNRGIAREQ